MKRRRFLWLMSLLLLVAVVAWSSGDAFAKKPVTTDDVAKKFNKVPFSEQKAAAKRAKSLGLKPGVAAPATPTFGATPLLGAAAPILPGTEGPGGIPHYFGPYGNWAYSPLPSFGLVANVTIDSPGTGYSATPTVTITDVYGTGTATASATVVNGAITAITVSSDPPSSGFHVPFVTITDPTGTGAAATAVLDLTTLTGGMRKFVDSLPGLGPAGANNIDQDPVTPGVQGQYLPVAVADKTAYPKVSDPGQPNYKPASDYYEIAVVEYTEKMHSDLPPTRLRGYVQLETPGTLAAMAAMNPPQVSKHVSVGNGLFAVDNPHYLGPIILAQGRVHGVPNALPTDPGYPKPVRIKFYNLLPVGAGGDLFLPVDDTIPGAGLGPALPGTAGDKFSQNRADIHLHGNNTVWLSDGNVHQWISPANENTPYPAGVSARNVPDMPGCADPTLNDPLLPGSSGCMTLFYTNAQSARLQFYHDHSLGITRLNVYAGEAGGYVITDAVDQDMINGTNVTGIYGIDSNGAPIPGIYPKVLPDIGIPLVVQDRTWVEAATIFAQDPTWNWGTGTRDASGNLGGLTPAVDGDLWYPHVYMSAQNPWDLSGTNAFGRWHYGPWFNPPVPTCVGGLPVGCIDVGPVPNEYYQPVCDGLPDPVNTVCTAPWEPPMRPGVPNPSIAGEGFMDTPTVNGTAYPVLKVEPKAYRFRVLNAANDRMFNLQLYVAHDKKTWVSSTGPAVPGSPTAPCDTTYSGPLTDCTEVKMISVAGAPNQFADWPSGIPDPTTKGPDWILIGTEGGFVPAPVLVPQQPVGWNLNPTTFNFGVVNQHSLLLGSAERADVVVDFSAFAGKTLILYNDAPAAFPAGVPAYDYFTGVADQIDVGGAPSTQPGYGPNTRTIMQIQVANTPPAAPYDLTALNTVFAKTPTKRGVFEVAQDPIIIPQAAYNSAYNNTFPSTAAQQYIQVADTEKTFQPINEAGVLQSPVTLPLEMKAMHDEMGGVYDTQFGRMSGMLGLSNPTSPVHVLIPYGLASPPTDLVMGSVEGSPIGVMPDGTQIWRIFHNGVDTHTIHTHLFHTQLINRIAQDGIQLGVDPIELGWKDTFRVNPLEITYLAMRPTVPTPGQVPFEVPDSVRLIDPTLPEGATLTPPAPAGWFDPEGNAITEILNHYVNFGWEYVWHCHILAHEEMDMMHSLVFAVPPRAPTGLTATWNGNANSPRITLNWVDNSTKETRFTVQRATNDSFTTGLTSFNVAASAGTGAIRTYTDATVARSTTYWYRVLANGPVVGDTAAYAGSPLGFPTMTADSVSNTASASTSSNVPLKPAAPTNLTATLQTGPQVSLTWRDNATNETYFAVERAVNGGAFAQIAAPGARTNTGNVTYVDTTVTPGNSYLYRVAAVNGGGFSAYATLASPVVVPAIPAAPTSFTVSAVKASGPNYTATLNWISAVNPASFTIQRANNATFNSGLSTITAAGTARSLTQTVTRNTTYYYRIRANNGVGGSSAWRNALPYPIRTGP